MAASKIPLNRRGIATSLSLLAVLSCGDSATAPAPPPPPVPPPAPRPTTVSVSPATAELTAVGATVQLTAEVRDQNGRTMAGATVTWASAAAAVATVNSTGLATAVANGTVTITATAGDASGSASLTVAQEVSAVAVTSPADTPEVGDTLRLLAAATDANGQAVEGAAFTWSSSDASVVSVDGSGLVTAVAVGTAVVTAASSGVSGSAELVVIPAVGAVAVRPDTVRFTALGQSVRLSAGVFDHDGRVLPGVAVSWSSGDAAVASVDSLGLVTAVGAGATAVTAVAGRTAGEAVVTVMQSANSVVVSPPAGTIAPGDTLRFTAEAFDENDRAVLGAEFNWMSGDRSVATVDSSGLVRGVAVGEATISATAGSARGTARIAVANSDRATLEAFYRATNGPNWVNSDNWLTDAPLDDWYGVDTDGDGRVVRLVLEGTFDLENARRTSHGLTGSIPPELGRLAHLVVLNLRQNKLTGPIPPELGGLIHLEILNLGRNALTGPIPPELGSLSRLTWMSLLANNLTGPIPPELGSPSRLTWMSLSGNNLTGPIPPELGRLSRLERVYLYGNSLEGTIPPELGNLSRLERLFLYGNNLEGTIPPELGNLSRLERLFVHGNNLEGTIPPSLLQLVNLTQLDFRGNDGLCAPGTASFAAWLRDIEDGGGPFCNQADREALEDLYESAGGSNWRDSDAWLATQALEEWYGVTADSLGRVTELDLAGNGLTGEPSRALRDLSRMTVLRIGDNGLSGRLPLGWIALRLVELHYAGTQLCVPEDDNVQRWLNGISTHTGTGVACEDLSDRDILEVFYEATGGPNWSNNDNWLTDAPLDAWYGVEADTSGRVSELSLASNGLAGRIPAEFGKLQRPEGFNLHGNALTGPIPPELGNLSGLRWLYLSVNDLKGPIPPEFGNLSRLERLLLYDNNLQGPIPPEFGNLSRLERLLLYDNNLQGPIPPEFGNLSRLERLYLHENHLEGPIPPELGNLSSLERLLLYGNNLMGPIPPELGKLTILQQLLLDDNELSGFVSAELAALTRLRELRLSNNTELEGPLPIGLTALDRLEEFLAGGTGLCAPSDPEVQAWLRGIGSRWVAVCAEEESPTAYLTQAVQSLKFPVPLVAGERSLLRVFPTAERSTFAGIPPVRARFFIDGRETHVQDIPGQSVPIPVEVDESRLSTSANAEIPGWVVQPGLEMVMEIDPEGTLDPALGVAERIPATGRLAVEVKAMPLFDLTLIPFVWTETRDSSIVDVVRAMAADPANHERLGVTLALLPIGDLAVTAHEPVLSSSNNAFTLLRETSMIRTVEGGDGHYKGMMMPPVTGAGGVAYRPGSSSFSQPYPDVIAHELGHNLNLWHAPCGNPTGVDPSFPHPDGSIGAWGYDFDSGLVPPSIPDLMTYCGPPDGISDYHFARALRFRLSETESAAAPDRVPPTRTLLVWGGADADSVPFLEPAFVVETLPQLPRPGGDYRLSGRSADGAELFSLTFDMAEVADGDGSSSFAFALPVRDGWAGNLENIVMTGPGGSATLDGDSNFPMAILRNPRNGRVSGILRNLASTVATQAAAEAGLAGAAGLQVLFSGGIPGGEAWRE